jgi:hypothetical protein
MAACLPGACAPLQPAQAPRGILQLLPGMMGGAARAVSPCRQTKSIHIKDPGNFNVLPPVSDCCKNILNHYDTLIVRHSGSGASGRLSV